MATWQYHVEQFQMIDRWTSKRSKEEFAAFNERLNVLGQQGWELIGYNPIHLKGGITGNSHGTLHVCFFKKQLS